MNIGEKISTAAANIPPSGIRKFWELAMSIDNVLSLCVGEPDYAPPQKVLQTCMDSLAAQHTHYTANAGLIELRRAIIDMYREKYGVTYTEKELMVTIGASEAIDLALRVLVNPGDEVLIPDPAYVAYPAVVKLNGGVPVMVPTYATDDFKLTVKELEKKLTPRTKLLVMGYPSNPTGAILEEEELKEIADFAIKHDLIVISDEIYAELTYSGRHVSLASMPGMKERSLILNGFSKAYAMTGLRIGYLCAPATIIEACIKIHQYSIVAAATPIQEGAVVALRECEEEVVAMREEYRARRDLIVAGFQKMGLPIAVPQGAFYVFPDISATGLTDEEFAEQLLLAEKVAVVPGSAFGACGKNHIRCSYASSRETIAEALTRIERFVNSKHG